MLILVACAPAGGDSSETSRGCFLWRAPSFAADACTATPGLSSPVSFKQPKPSFSLGNPSLLTAVNDLSAALPLAQPAGF